MINSKYYKLFSCGKIDTIKGITIHNTGNNKNAKENYDYFKNLTVPYSCHFFVDENEVIKALPLSQGAWHTGKGYDLGNTSTIAIEICQSYCDDEIYLKAQNRAIVLVKELMNKYSLTTSDIYFHNDFDVRKYCPHRILDIYKNKQEFIRKEFN